VGVERARTFPGGVPVNATLRFARRAAGAIYKQIHPSPELSACRMLETLAARTPRHTTGRVHVLGFDVEYADLQSFCPQFGEMFVHDSLAFQTSSSSPRILDCGSNVGLASLCFRRRYPAARITAYEADPALCAMTGRNLARNGASDIEVVHAALWTSTGDVAFRAEGSDSGMIEGLAGAADLDARAVTVPSLRLRDVLAAERIDLLKLDVEGAEGALLADCEPVLDRVGAIIMDLHEFDPRDRQSPRVFESLSRSGFVYSIDDMLLQHWRPPLSSDTSPFPKTPLVWTMTVRAWRQ
jgi:FkbM family methyltransferase